MTGPVKLWSWSTVSSLRDLPRKSWDDLNVESCYLTYDWLVAVETSFRVQTRYALVLDEAGRLLAAAPCYVVSPSSTRNYNPLLIASGSHLDGAAASVLAPSERREYEDCRQLLSAVSARFFPALVSTTLEGQGPGLVTRRALDTDDKHYALLLLQEAISKLGEELGCATTSVLYLDPSSEAHAILEEAGYVRVALKSRAYLNLVWRDFSEYLSSTSAHRRTSIRREIRVFDRSRLSVEVRTLQDVPSETLARLLANVQAKYHGPQERARVSNYVEYIEYLKSVPLGNRIYLAIADGEVAGFSLLFEHGSAWFMRIVGFEYALLGKDYAYFNSFFYHPIADALRAGVQRIDYGLGSLESKRARGCHVLRTWGYLRTGELLRPLVQKSASLVTLAAERIEA